MSALFGNLGASQNKPSLFGNASVTSQGGGLFGGINTQNPPQAASSLFGSTMQPQQSGSSSLFGSASNSQPQAQPSTSLFGSTNTAQPQQQTGTGAFGSTSTSTAQQGLQSSQAPQTQGQKSGAYFDTLLEKSRKRAHGETALEDLPSLQLGLGDLRERIKRLNPSPSDRGADGRAHYLLAASGVEPGTAVRDLNDFAAHSVRLERPQNAVPVDTDVESYIAGLQTQTTMSMIAEGLSRSVRDFDHFLQENVALEWDAQRKRIYQHFGIKPRPLNPASPDGPGMSSSVAGNQGGFGRSRRGKGHPSQSSKTSSLHNGNLFGKSSLHRSVIGSVSPFGSTQRPAFHDADINSQGIGGNTHIASTDRFLREKEAKFAERVKKMNLARLDNKAYPLLHEFEAVETSSAGGHLEYVINAYKALEEIVGEDSGIQSFSDPDVMKERQFAAAYLDDDQQSAKATALRKKILRGATRHLEKQSFQDMETILAKNPREANLGGVPNVLSKVKAYVRLRASRKDLAPDNTDLQMLDDDYVWAVIFYLVRTGHIKEATEYVSANRVAFRAIDRYFASYVSEFYNSSERRLGPELQARINNEYNQRLRIAPEHSIDPFRMACYKIIGRCDLTNRSLAGLHQNLPDWAWLQFSLAREVNLVDEHAGDVFTLTNVQESVQIIGARHFGKGATTEQKSGSGIFFYLQVISGLFEDAVRFLYDIEYADAMHFAIALDYYGLLRVSDLSSAAGELLTHNTRGRPQINFAQMIGWYTRDFRAADVAAAVDYLTLICLNSDLPGDAGRQQVSVCHQGLRELVLESREFAKLLGDMSSDGRRVMGVIEERMKLLRLYDTDDFVRTVTIQAASIADDSGRITDAVLLYHLAEEYDNVITIINRALSEAVAVDIGQDKISLVPLRPRIDAVPSEEQKEQTSSLSLTSVDDPVKLAQTMVGIYNNHSMFYEKISQTNKETCHILLKMSEARDLVEAEKWTQALDVIAGLRILPLEARGDSTIIRQTAAKYSSLPETITRNVPNLIMWTGRSCEKQRMILANAQYGSDEGIRRQMIDDLKRKAKDLTMYAGFLKYRLPPWVNDMLARIAAE